MFIVDILNSKYVNKGHSVSTAASYCQMALLTAARPSEHEHHGDCILKCQHCSASAEMSSSNTEHTEHSYYNHRAT